ncbi:hypothetical protein [Clostridium massiliamazoniense]|uniref:hypothetical protein n=1 Tax=Clostridium massiliamazoniense TaxID=1347366 RepID=UPI0006D82841|nr:hypothetical protein [Clostridium massiliamazoniense]
MNKKFKIIIALIVIIGGGMVYEYISTGKPPITTSTFSRPQATIGDYEILMNGSSGVLNDQAVNFTVINTSNTSIPALKNNDITLIQNNKIIPSNEYKINISSDNDIYQSGQQYELSINYDFKHDTKYPLTLSIKVNNNNATLTIPN